MRMKTMFSRALIAASLPIMAQTASAIVLLTDNFTTTWDTAVNGGANQNVNYELGGGRLGGTLAPGFIASGNAYTGSVNDHHQVGNSQTPVGNPDKNFVLLAFNGSFQTNIDIAASAIGPVRIEYDLFIHGGTNPGGGAPDDWGAVTLRSAASVDGWPVVPAGEFGFLTRRDGRVQGFQGAYPGVWDTTPGFAMADHWILEFTDTAGTGSAFNGNGSQVTITNGTNLLGTVTLNQLNSSNLQLTFRNYNSQFVGIDNLSISTVPEPTGAVFLCAGLGMVALRRRKSRA